MARSRPNGSLIPPDKTNNLFDLKKAVKKKYINSNEIIIIEMTDTWSWKWSSGFVDYLYEYLLKESRR